MLCLLVSGGNSQIVRVDSPLKYEILGQTIDDAVGEAFDKCSKMMGLGYPGGPIVDRLAKEGDPLKYKFSKPHIPGFDYSFSGIKTSLLYFVRDQIALDPDKVNWANVVKEQKLPWINVCDSRGAQSPYVLTYNLAALPAVYIISDGGLVDGQAVDEKSLRKLLNDLLK